MDGHCVSDMKCDIVRVRFQKDLFAICECRTKATVPPDAVCGFDPSSETRDFIAVGDGLLADVGKTILLSGRWEKNPKFNNTQLRISDCKEHVGSSRDEIIAYLSSNILKGIGEKTAGAIYDMFGPDSISVIETNPMALLRVTGIKEKKLAKIITSYEKNRELHALARLLAPFQVPYRTIVRIYRHLGEGAAAKIRSNPYTLCDVMYFGFRQADAIAMKMGNFANSTFRIAGGIIYVLREAQIRSGHLYLPRETLAHSCCGKDILNSTEECALVPQQIYPVIDKMLLEGAICELVIDGEGLPLEEQRIYLRDAYTHEAVAARGIARTLAGNPEKQNVDWLRIVQDTEKSIGVTLDERQRAGAVMALSSQLSIITGGPGTGKTTSLKAIVTSYAKTYPQAIITLAAPTGRAARRMTAQTGREATTLHSLLGLKPDAHTDFSTPPDENEMIPAGLLVVDEASMIDAHLLAELMHRLPTQTKVLFLGDADQLPSVGPGNVLWQLLACPLIPNTKLAHIFRQSDGSVIPRNAAAIKSGRNDLVLNKHFKLLLCKDEEEGARTIVQIVRRGAERGMLGDAQILCPMKNRGATCTKNINVALHNIVNPPAPEKREITIGTTLFREGDRVMQTVNRRGASNGDIGHIVAIAGPERKQEDVCVHVRFDSSDEIIEYDYDEALELEHATAITIHKSQGSEFGAIIVPLFRSMSFFLRRNIFYTAVTRAKIQVVVVCDEAGLDAAIKREDTSKRNTMLAKAIIEESRQSPIAGRKFCIEG